MDPISMAAESFSVHGPGGVRIVADRLGDPRARAVVFLHGGGQTRRSWGRAAAAVAERGWQAVTIDLRGHGESDWSSEGDYRLVSFAGDIQEVLRNLPGQPALVGASPRWVCRDAAGGELSPGIASAVVLVDIVPNMDLAGASRIHAFMAERVESGSARWTRWLTSSPTTTRIGRGLRIRMAWWPTCAAAVIAGIGTGIRSSSVVSRRFLP